jgi:hypothetical protein
LGARRRARVVLDGLFGDEGGEYCFGIFVDVEGLYQSVVEGELSALGGVREDNNWLETEVVRGKGEARRGY